MEYYIMCFMVHVYFIPFERNHIRAESAEVYDVRVFRIR